MREKSTNSSPIKLQSKNWGMALALIAAVGFSAKAILVKLSYGVSPVSSITLLTLRMAFALPAFMWLAWSTSRGVPALPLRAWLAIIVLGMLGYYGASIFDFAGLHYVSAALERIILFTYPALTLVISALFFGHQITRREIAALVLCSLGLLGIFAHETWHSATLGDQLLLGSALVFASAICYALYLSGGASLIARWGAVRFTALALLVSTIATFTHFIIAEPLSALLQPWRIYAYALAMAIFSTVVPVFAQALALRALGAGTTALISMVGPMITIFLGVLILNEKMSFSQLLGAITVIAGIWLVRPKARPTK